MFDITQITTRELARQARTETMQAIERNEQAMRDRSPTFSAELAAELQDQLHAIEQLIQTNDW